MFISEHVTLGNDPCNLCRNKIARQVARKFALCTSAFSLASINFHSNEDQSKNEEINFIFFSHWGHLNALFVPAVGPLLELTDASQRLAVVKIT